MAEKFDVTIIGSGIGGLITGCYLARENLKVCIVEQHSKPGGYCTSFNRKGFNFDVGVHYIGAIKRGVFGRILSELDLDSDLRFYQFNPSDKIIMPDFEVNILSDPKLTLAELKRVFPDHRESLVSFFDLILARNFLPVYSKIKRLTFLQLLDSYFSDFKLKAVFNILLGNIGIPSSRISALAAVVLFRTYILDPGYYPKGGMQEIPDRIIKKFVSFGGKTFFSARVKKILLKDGKVSSIQLEKDLELKSKVVISNADATNTFCELLDVKSKESRLVRSMEVTPSAFVAYLGVNKDIREHLHDESSRWHCYTYDIDDQFNVSRESIQKQRLPWVLLTFPSCHDRNCQHNKSTLGVFTIAPYENSEFWEHHRASMLELMISHAEKIVPKLRQHLIVAETATPLTFAKYTSNRRGAAFGWAATLDQIKPKIIPQISSIPGLYLTGHWCTGSSGQCGVTGVAFSGRKVAEIVMASFKIKWRYGLSWM